MIFSTRFYCLRKNFVQKTSTASRSWQEKVARKNMMISRLDFVASSRVCLIEAWHSWEVWLEKSCRRKLMIFLFRFPLSIQNFVQKTQIESRKLKLEKKLLGKILMIFIVLYSLPSMELRSKTSTASRSWVEKLLSRNLNNFFLSGIPLPSKHKWKSRKLTGKVGPVLMFLVWILLPL